jgi:hypothetical protein
MPNEINPNEMNPDEINRGSERQPRCAEVEERLPWLLNGTLEPAARERVLSHVRACAGCRQALAECHEAGLAADTHLSIDMLLDLADGRSLGGPDQRLAAAHLDACDRCAGELRVLSTGDGAHVHAWPAEVAAAGAIWRPLAIAAVFAALILGLGWWRASVDLRAGAARMLVPIVNVAMIELRPIAPSRGPEATISLLEAPADARLVSLVLLPEMVVTGPRTLDVVAPGGTVLWQLDGLQQGADGAVSLVLPIDLLETGDHRLRLRSVNESGAERVEVFALRVAPRP